MKKEKWRSEGRELTRYKVRERDSFTCQSCGKAWKEGSRHFDVHHLNGLCGTKSRGYDKSAQSVIDTLITLCHKCHFNRHDWAGKKKLQKTTLIERNTRIRQIYSMGETKQSELAKQYKVSRQRIFQILKSG